MTVPTQVDRGGRSHNLGRIARQLLRRHGTAWLAEMERAASLGDPSAILAVVELSREPTRQGPTAKTGP